MDGKYNHEQSCHLVFMKCISSHEYEKHVQCLIPCDCGIVLHLI